VLRPFLVKGQRQEVGTEFSTDDRVFASALVHEQKAAYVGAVEQRGPMTTETAAGAVSGKAPKAGTNKPAAAKPPAAAPHEGKES
jgi:hypothetical protein